MQERCFAFIFFRSAFHPIHIPPYGSWLMWDFEESTQRATCSTFSSTRKSVFRKATSVLSTLEKVMATQPLKCLSRMFRPNAWEFDRFMRDSFWNSFSFSETFNASYVSRFIFLSFRNSSRNLKRRVESFYSNISMVGCPWLFSKVLKMTSSFSKLKSERKWNMTHVICWSESSG